MTDRLKINQLYSAPTAIRMLIKCGNEHVNPYKRDTLRVLGCGTFKNHNLCIYVHALQCELSIHMYVCEKVE